METEILKSLSDSKGGELHEVMDCLLNHRSHIGYLVPLVLTWNTGIDSGVSVRNIFTLVLPAIADGEEDAEDNLVEVTVFGHVAEVDASHPNGPGRYLRTDCPRR